MAARRALKAVLVDLNGTLHIEDAAVPGAQEALKRQAVLQVACHFCDGSVCDQYKPEKTFFLEALEYADCAPEEAVMIGDDCRDDVDGAQNIGMLGILVKTGKYKAADEKKINPPPYLTCESFPHAVDHILQHLL